MALQRLLHFCASVGSFRSQRRLEGKKRRLRSIIAEFNSFKEPLCASSLDPRFIRRFKIEQILLETVLACHQLL